MVVVVVGSEAGVRRGLRVCVLRLCPMLVAAVAEKTEPSPARLLEC